MELKLWHKIAAVIFLLLLIFASINYAHGEITRYQAQVKEYQEAAQTWEDKYNLAQVKSEQLAQTLQNVPKVKEVEVEVIRWEKEIIYRESTGEVVKPKRATYKKPGVEISITGLALADTCDINIDSNIICQHWINLVNEGKPVKEEFKPKSPITRGPLIDGRVGYGYSGIDAEVGTWPIQIGGERFKILGGVYGQMTMRQDGGFDGNASVGVRITWK